MSFIEIIFIGLSLAMDAFAISICKGLSVKNYNKYTSLKIAAYFSIFQMLMPIIGYLIGSKYASALINVSHIICFVILLLIGLNMFQESNTTEEYNDRLDIKEMLLLSIATSIDALAIGLTFAFLKTSLIKSIPIIGIVTFILCYIGPLIGYKIGDKYKDKSLKLGALIIIIIAIKILITN